MGRIDHTHDARRRSWVASANGGDTDFPIQNLPLGIFTPGSGGGARCGVAIGDSVLDLRLAAERGLLRPSVSDAVVGSSLDALSALGRSAATALRHDVFALLEAEAETRHEDLLHGATGCSFGLPTTIPGFTDFYAGIHHAQRCGEIMNPSGPFLPPNYHHLPLGYNGRSSTVRASGSDIRRPLGWRRQLDDAQPTFGACAWMDFEFELGVFVGAGNPIGEPVAIADAAEHALGVCLLNDWSARDLQLFEMMPLGPLNSKSLGTSISPWIVTADALEPFRVPAMPRYAEAPVLAAYLDDADDRQRGGLDIELRATLSTDVMRDGGQPPELLLETNARHLYWTISQMIAHHTINGCTLLPGDLIGTGTISGPTQSQYASLFELTAGGRTGLKLSNGESRTFLEDGDEVTFRGRCRKPGYASIGFGMCSGRIATAPRGIVASESEY